MNNNDNITKIKEILVNIETQIDEKVKENIQTDDKLIVNNIDFSIVYENLIKIFMISINNLTNQLTEDNVVFFDNSMTKINKSDENNGAFEAKKDDEIDADILKEYLKMYKNISYIFFKETQILIGILLFNADSTNNDNTNKCIIVVYFINKDNESNEKSKIISKSVNILYLNLEHSFDKVEKDLFKIITNVSLSGGKLNNYPFRDIQEINEELYSKLNQNNSIKPSTVLKLQPDYIKEHIHKSVEYPKNTKKIYYNIKNKYNNRTNPINRTFKRSLPSF